MTALERWTIGLWIVGWLLATVGGYAIIEGATAAGFALVSLGVASMGVGGFRQLGYLLWFGIRLAETDPGPGETK